MVDNKSTDNSLQLLNDLASDTVKILAAENNGGYSAGNNIGAKYLLQNNIDIMFISNPDVYIKLEDLKKIEYMMEISGYAMLSGFEYNINDSIIPNPLPHTPSYMDDLKACFYLGRKIHFKKTKSSINFDIPIQDCEQLIGSFFAIQMSYYKQLGQFDERVFLYCEERILAAGIRQFWGKIGIVTAAKYNHNHSVSISKTYKSVEPRMRMLYESRLYYHKTYTKIKQPAVFLLSAAMKFSLFEFRIKDKISSKIKGVHGNGTDHS